jgi:hypothetical protein
MHHDRTDDHCSCEATSKSQAQPIFVSSSLALVEDAANLLVTLTWTPFQAAILTSSDFNTQDLPTPPPRS